MLRNVAMIRNVAQCRNDTQCRNVAMIRNTQCGAIRNTQCRNGAIRNTQWGSNHQYAIHNTQYVICNSHPSPHTQYAIRNTQFTSKRQCAIRNTQYARYAPRRAPSGYAHTPIRPYAIRNAAQGVRGGLLSSLGGVVIRIRILMYRDVSCVYPEGYMYP
jgi:hypothetical protein